MLPFKFCPKCADHLSLSIPAYGHKEELTCNNCQFVFYQNSKPTASVIPMRNSKEILLCKRGIEPQKGYWDVIGGFLENGEDPEKGALREFKEETRGEVKLFDILGIFIDSYYHRQYNLFTFNVIYLGKLKGKIDQLTPSDDITELRWFPLNKPPHKIAFFFIHEVIKALAVYQKTKATFLKKTS